MAPGAKIMSVKVLDANRAGDSSQLAKGIRYAIGMGAKILNVSINGDGTSPDLDDALKYASQQGATVVASAGNQTATSTSRPSYPASSAEPSVLTVTATQTDGSLLGIANRGLRSVDLAAPGGYILSTARGSGYEMREGTSMAAPFVAGSLALLAAARPDLPQSTLRAALVQSAPRPKLLAGLLGSGALNVAAAHAQRPARRHVARHRPARRRRGRRRPRRADRAGGQLQEPRPRRPHRDRQVDGHRRRAASPPGASCSTEARQDAAGHEVAAAQEGLAPRNAPLEDRRLRRRGRARRLRARAVQGPARR